MEAMRQRVHDENDELDCVRCCDYYIPNIRLDGVAKSAPIGKWGRMHRDYLLENNSLLYNHLLLAGKLWSYLADLNKQAQEWLEVIICRMKEAECVTEELKRRD